MSKKSGKFNTNGGNGGYAKKKPVKTKPNPQKSRKPYIDYNGNDVTKRLK